MCGRFAQPRSAEDLARIFNARPATDLAGGRFNVAPTDPLAAVVEHHGERVVDAFHWGLVPAYAESARGAARLVNARAETVEESPAFRTSFKHRRCLIPADAFYEWRHHPAPRTQRGVRSEPFAIRLAADEPMAFAGLWAAWRDPASAERRYTACIVTGPPNDLVARIHDRMPVIVHPDDWATWLAEDAPAEELRPLLRPAPAEGMRLYAVSPAVNNVRSDGPELLAPLSRWQSELWPA